MAEAGSWPLILEHGLLSTSAILDLSGYSREQRDQIEARHRPHKLTLSLPTVGTVIIRDQKPMRDSVLRTVLDGCTPEEWYRLLNGKVFFWPTRKRLLRFLGAKAYRDADQIVITVDTERLLNDYRKSATLSPINSGATLFNAIERGMETFVPIPDYPWEYGRRKRSRSEAVAEIAIDRGVMNVASYVTEVRCWRGDSPRRVIWTP